MSARVLAAELTWDGSGFVPGLGVWIDDDGRVARVAALDGLGTAHASESGGPVERLSAVALVPGFVSAHSHAFQRGLRGHGELFPSGAGSFWTWREAMYGLVEALSPERLFDLSLLAFREMRAAGITLAGEFHYLHHSAAGADFVGDEAVLAAGREAGIRLVLLQAYYKTGGIGGPLRGAQRRFETVSLGQYWDQMEHLAGCLQGGTQTLAVAAHSLRAVPLPELRGLLAESRRQGLPFHLHLEEQRQEITECRATYGKRPLELLLELAGGLEGVTAVHCTHSRPDQLRRFAESGGRICACPLTEANLGDGIPALAAVPESRGRICLGTDSNARISMLEEMRWLEYGQRLKTESRGVLADPAGALAGRLLEAGTRTGADSLGVVAGRMTPGAWADFAAVDLASPLLAPGLAEQGLAGLVFGCGDQVIVNSCVGGEWLRPWPATAARVEPSWSGAR